MNSLLHRTFKFIPIIAKKLTIFPIIYSHYHIFTNPPIQCSSLFNKPLMNNISEMQSNIISIKCNGCVVGYAYCFLDGYLISTNLNIVQNKHPNNKYEYYINDKRLNGNFKVLGLYENLVVIQGTLSNIKSLPSGEINQEKLQQVQIVQKKEYLSIKNGYFVAKDSGYGIVCGKGEVGNLIIKDGKVLGIVSQVGRQSQDGFLRILEWKHLPKILKYVKGERLHLGISAQMIEGQQGISIVRVSPNSIMNNDIMMGDIILKANGQKLRETQALSRICLESQNNLNLLINRQGKQLQINIRL